MHVLDKGHSYEEVTEIFVRVNSLGMKLRTSDLALAQITSRWQDSLKLFEQFQEECEEKWFTLELGLLVRALVVFTTNQSRFKTAGTIPVQELATGWEETKRGINFAVSFLRANAGIEDETLLSSSWFIIALAYYGMSKNYTLNLEDEKDLRRWLYLAHIKGHYSGSTESTLDADLRIMKTGTARDLLDALKQQVGRLEILSSDFLGRGPRSALFSMSYLALKARGAKDWRTRLGLSLTHQGRYHFIEHHHIFPKALLRRRGFEKAEIHEIANMAFVTGGTNRGISSRPPSEYLQEILQTEGGSETLEAHCIPLNPELWSMESYREFLEYRRAALTDAINGFILNDEGGKLTLDISEVIAAGEREHVEFKSSARWDYREGRANKALELVIAKSLAGFLNSNGGTLLIGVDDAGIILGLEQDFKTLGKRPDRDGYQQMLVNLVSSSMGKEACSYLSISFHPIDGKEVCMVAVEQSPKPIYVSDSGATRFYIRTGNTTQELSTKDTVEYIRNRWPSN